MNNFNQLHSETLQNRYGLRVTARLAAGTESLPHDVTERLRASRERAIAKRKTAAAPVLQRRHAHTVSRNGDTLVMGGFGDDGMGFWGRISSFALVVALAVGLIAINVVQDNDRAIDVAEVDAALLTDDLPPAAYTDPGFLQFLKSSARESSTAR